MPASSSCCRKWAASELGSIVVPDLLASTYSVRSGGVTTARTAAGSVESSMWKRGQPSATPITARSTSGARLDPPIPSRTTSVNPSALMRSANAVSRSRESAISIGERIQPKRSAMAFWTSGSWLQTAGSARQSPAAARSAAAAEVVTAFAMSGDRCSELFRRARLAATSSAGQRVISSCALDMTLEYCSHQSSVVSPMARGFESKDVEFQQAEKERGTRLGRALTPEERDAQARRRTIELALARVNTDLAAARTPAHKRMLVAAIAALEQQLANPV